MCIPVIDYIGFSWIRDINVCIQVVLYRSIQGHEFGVKHGKFPVTGLHCSFFIEMN